LIHAHLTIARENPVRSVHAGGSGRPSGHGGKREPQGHDDDEPTKSNRSTMAVDSSFGGGSKSCNEGSSDTEIISNDEMDGIASISTLSPPDEVNTRRWEFGPKLSTNEIIFAARGFV
jgi:hypothetical protein